MDKYFLENKIKEYHDKHDKGQIPVFSNVVLIEETLTTLMGSDLDCIAFVLHDGDQLERVFHLSVEAAAKLMLGLEELFDEDELDDADDDDN